MASMADLTVSPTRMELARLKERLRTASRGHKLLKDQRDGLMKQLLSAVHRSRELRQQVEEPLLQACADLTMAAAALCPELPEQALLYSIPAAGPELHTRRVLSVTVPLYRLPAADPPPAEPLPCGLAQSSAELDAALTAYRALLPQLLALAEAEKTVQLLACRIESLRRRVNALEYVLLPRLQADIRSISMKLEENERGSITRLMKVKELVLSDAIREKRAREARRG